MKRQIHVCARCGKEMSYTDKRMVYLYRCREYGKMEPVAHVDLCKEHARELWRKIRRYGDKEDGRRECAKNMQQLQIHDAGDE